MTKKKGLGRFICGAVLGAGLGVLFAPKKGSETRKQLIAKIEELMAKVKDTDLGEIKANLEMRLDEIKKQLDDLDKEKVLKIAKEKVIQLKNKTGELVELVIEKGTPILKKIDEEVKEKTILAAHEVIKRLEKKGKKD